MLRRFELKSAWRSLGQDFWPKDTPFGKKTVIYGHNGSGKSTLSELLLKIANGDSETEIVWEDETGRRSSLAPGSPSPVPGMAVFTRRWVEENLSAFLNGETASAIVTLGKEAIEARDEEASLHIQISDLQKSLKQNKDTLKETQDQLTRLIKEVQNEVVGQLKEADHDYYTKNRFSSSKIKNDLQNYDFTIPETEEYATALKRLYEPAPQELLEISSQPCKITGELSELQILLTKTPVRAAIQELENNAKIQTWVEQGLVLHKDFKYCMFCNGKITDSRWNTLERHFDDSWRSIREQARSSLTTVEREVQELLNWCNALPAKEQITSVLQEKYINTFQNVTIEVNKRVEILNALANILKQKVEDPSLTLQEGDWSALRLPLNITILTEVIDEHNDQVKRQKEIKKGLEKTVYNYLIGSRAKNFRKLEEKITGLKKEENELEEKLESLSKRFDEVRRSRFTTTAMANQLTQDLARVYGKDYLTVEVTSDGKSYSCKRDGKPATNLSDGERTTLSLLYFLRRLEDKREPDIDSSCQVLVIDDPSSSLDREALFATHQWLFDTLKDYGQYVILTHDFNLLRLFMKSHKNSWGTSLKKISKGDKDEMRFPKVSFLEIHATSQDGVRRSKIAKMPHFLINNTSEYAYLFSMLMSGIADSENYERLFLLPNAARRTLEIFASYKAPHRSDFSQRLEVLVQSQKGEPFRDVYDFCNRFSHGEGSESVDVLDARVVSGQIRRCMEFLRSIDKDHFDKMCKATNTGHITLS